MADPNLNMTDEKEAILKQFRINVDDILQPTHDDRYLLRWLRARKFNLVAAEKMIREDHLFRKERNSDHLTRKNSLTEELWSYTRLECLGFDYVGHPVYFFNMPFIDLKGFHRSCTLKMYGDYLITVVEEARKRLKEHNLKNGKQVETLVYVGDSSNFNLKQFYDKQIIQYSIASIKTFQDHYPELLHCMYVINAPKFAVHLLNFFKPFLDEVVYNKIKIYSEEMDWKDDIFRNIPKEIIPAYVGGERYEPEGDPYCSAFLNWKTPVPYSLYTNATKNFECQGLEEVIITPRSIFEVSKLIIKMPSLLSWEFQTKDYDIKFGLSLRQLYLGQQSSKEQCLITPTIIDCHLSLEKNEYVCRKPGLYVLSFDNRQSWFTAKQLLYNVDVQQILENF